MIDDRPPLSGRVVRITSQEAAKDQLHSAIRLWFDEQNLASIHTLAIAAQGMLDVMCSDKRIKRSELNADTKSRPRRLQDSLRSPQNFFKHGRHKQRFKGIVSYVPQHTELVMLDCLAMYERLFGKVTPLMSVFGIWQSVSNPNIGLNIDTSGIKVEDLAGLGRADFLKNVLPRLEGK
jgi:hypothetical protein